MAGEAVIIDGFFVATLLLEETPCVVAAIGAGIPIVTGIDMSLNCSEDTIFTDGDKLTLGFGDVAVGIGVGGEEENDGCPE